MRGNIRSKMKYSGQKIVVLAGLVILVCALCGCEKREETIGTVSLNLSVSDDSIVDTSDMSEENVVSDDSEDLTTDSLSSDKAVQWENVYPKDEELAYTKVLKSELPVVCTDDNGTLTFLDNYKDKGKDLMVNVRGFSVIDLDADGEIEAFLWGENGINVVLHYMNKKVYAYNVPYRTMNGIKKNGYFHDNSMGLRNGYGLFHVSGFDEEKIFCSVYACACFAGEHEENGNYVMDYVYYKDGYPPTDIFDDHRNPDDASQKGVQISEDEFNEIWDIFFNQWEDVDVYDFTDENIDRFFGTAD